MNKDKERARLAAIHFKDAPDFVTHVAMDEDGVWEFLELDPWDFAGVWIGRAKHTRCKHQPTTELDWRDTLLRRADHEV